MVDLARWTLRAVPNGVILPFVLHPALQGSEWARDYDRCVSPFPSVPCLSSLT